jgi:hypothetical protein
MTGAAAGRVLVASAHGRNRRTTTTPAGGVAKVADDLKRFLVQRCEGEGR